jgi:hypothetical protein
MRLQSLFSFILGLSLLISSCTNRSGSESANSVTDEREISNVTRVKIDGVINLVISQSDKPTLRIEGDESMIAKLQVIQEGDLLELKLDDNAGEFFENSTLDVFLSIGDLKEFDFEGVGNIKTDGTLKLGELQLNGSGVGNIVLDLEAKKIDSSFDLLGNLKLLGSADEVSLINNGIGNVDASGLKTRIMNLNSSGIGKVDVFCSEILTITVSGIGAVSYSGNPTTVNESISGIGKITRN